MERREGKKIAGGGGGEERKKGREKIPVGRWVGEGFKSTKEGTCGSLGGKPVFLH